MKIAVEGIWHLGSVTSICLASLGFKTLVYDDNKQIIDNFKLLGNSLGLIIFFAMIGANFSCLFMFMSTKKFGSCPFLIKCRLKIIPLLAIPHITSLESGSIDLCIFIKILFISLLKSKE